jgi:predicted acetyltransferase
LTGQTPNEVRVLVELVPATQAQKPILENLLQFYMHDFSEVIPLDVDADGKFDYPQLELYWTDPGRFPFLASADGRWAGFVFIKQIPQSACEGSIWDMAEFFVLRGHRRRGIGIRLVHLALQQFAGSWQVRVMESNSGACQFWHQAIESFTGASLLPVRTRVDGVAWYVFRFESRAGA